MINNDIHALSVLLAIGTPFVSDNWIGILLKTISYIYRRIWWIYEEFGDIYVLVVMIPLSLLYIKMGAGRGELCKVMKNIRDCLGMGDNSGMEMSRLRSTANGGLALISEERCYSSLLLLSVIMSRDICIFIFGKKLIIDLLSFLGYVLGHVIVFYTYKINFLHWLLYNMYECLFETHNIMCFLYFTLLIAE